MTHRELSTRNPARKRTGGSNLRKTRYGLWSFGLFAVYWLFLRSPSPRKLQRGAFVVLTDPREKHEDNIIPMLSGVERKYGTGSCLLARQSLRNCWQAGPDGLTSSLSISLCLRKPFSMRREM